jgi:periplasmic protein CpxP/Spy
MAGALVLSFLWCPLALAQETPQGDREAGWHQKMCTERYARKAARLAYLEAKLALTDQQRPAWNKWRQIKLDAAEQRRTACLQHQHREDADLTAIERAARREKFLSARLAQLQASKPALQALYDALNPEQKALFDRAAQRRHRHHWHQWHHHGWQHEGHDGDDHEGWHHEHNERM